MKRPIVRTVIAVIVSCAAASSMAQITLHQFTPGTPILSSEVNENFEALRSGLESAVTDVQAQRFTFTIQASDWGSNLHYGGGNVHRLYEIPTEAVGGVDLATFWGGGGAIVAYAQPQPAVSGYDDVKPLPYLWSVETGASDIGIKVEHVLNRNAIAISRTSVGWDNLSLADADLPASIDVTLVLIPTGGGS